MLNFFRKYAVHIAITIVIFFIGTLFTGAFFFGDMGAATEERKRLDPNEAVAFIGEVPVPKSLYFNRLEQFLLNRQNRLGHLIFYDPEELEVIKLTAFRQSLDHALLLQEAEDKKLKISRQDIKFALLDVYKQLNVTTKKELKAILQKNQVPYDAFLDNLKKEIKIRKILQSVAASVQVTEKDVLNYYTEIRPKQLFIKIDPSASSEAQDLVYKKAASISKEISEGRLSFDDAVRQYSEDKLSREKNGDLGWMRTNRLVRPVEELAFSLDVGEVSQPVRSSHGFHIIKLEGKRGLLRPKDFKMEEELKKLTGIKQELSLRTYMQALKQGKDLRVFQRDVQAIKAKVEGDVQGTLAAYQGQVSENPSNPMPHLSLAKMYLTQSDLKNADLQLKKAEIKLELDPRFKTPYFYLQKAEFYSQKAWKKSQAKALDQAIATAEGDLFATQYLLMVFKNAKDEKRTSILQKKLTRLEEAADKKKANQEASSTEPILSSPQSK